MAAKRVQLYCPSLKQNVNNYEIVPSATYEQNLEQLRAAFGTLKSAWPWNTHGGPITDFKDITDGQRILVAGDYFEAVQAETPLVIVVYQELDGWNNFTRIQKRERMTALRKVDRVTNKSILRLTLSRSAVISRLAAINAGNASMFRLSSAATCYARLLENWQMKFDALWAVPGQVVKPRAPEHQWDPKFLPTLAVLSEMTIGQALTVRYKVIGAVRTRGGEEISVKDVVKVINWLYENAG